MLISLVVLLDILAEEAGAAMAKAAAVWPAGAEAEASSHLGGSIGG